MKKQLIWFLVLFLFLAACRDKDNTGQPVEETVSNSGSTETQTPTTDTDETITLQFAVKDVYIDDYDDLITAFEQEHSNIKIQVKSVEAITVGMGEAGPGEINRRIAQATDVFPGQYAFGPNWRQLTLDLTPFIEADANFNRDGFPSGILQEADGTVRVLPMSLNPVLLFYNKEMFDNAGLDAPQPGWTWDEFRAAAKALTIRDGDEVAQWGLVHAFPGSLAFYAAQLDSWLVDWSAEPPRPRFTDPDVVEAVRQHTDLYLLDQVGPDGSTIEAYNEAESLIAAGRAAMWPAFYYELDRYAGEQSVGIVTFPRSDGNGRPETTMVRVDGFAISAGTTQPQAAWEWINFLSRQTPIVPGAIPARVFTREAAGLWRDVAPEVQQVVEDALAHSFKYYFSPANRLFGEALTGILMQEKSLTDALAEAQAAASQTLSTVAESEETEPFVVTNDEETSAESVTITFLPYSDNLEKYRLLANQFQAENPDIIVEVKWQQTTGFGSMNTDEKGEPGDCFQWPAPYLYNPDARDAILKLSPLIAADPTFDLNDFYPALMNSFTYQGEVWGLPAEYETTFIEYNKDLFDGAGVAYPQPGWTMEAFLDTAVALTKGEGDTKQYGFVPDVLEFNSLRWVLFLYGVNLVDTSVDPPTMVFTDPAAIEAVRWYVALSETYGVKPLFLLNIADVTQTSSSRYIIKRRRLIQEELAAMWIRRGGNQEENRKDVMGLANVGVAPLPVNLGVSAGGAFAFTGYMISANTSQRQACWQWIKFLTTVDAATGMPARRSVAESETYRRRVGDEVAAVYLANLNQAGASDTPAVRPAWMSSPATLWLGQAVAQILRDNVPVEEALAAAQQKFEAYRNCVIDRDAFYDLNVQYECSREVDPTIPDFIGSG